MNSQQLYLNITQFLGYPKLGLFHAQPKPNDYNRMPAVHVSRGSSQQISHITLEFRGIRAKYFICMTFDGTGDAATGLQNFAMPKMKLGQMQKALIQIAVLEFLIDHNHINANIDFLKDRIISEIGAATQAEVLPTYERACALTDEYLNAPNATVIKALDVPGDTVHTHKSHDEQENTRTQQV